MTYQGAEASRLYDNLARQTSLPDREALPNFEVLAGGGLDARARRGVSTAFIARLRLTVIGITIVVIVGLARVALSVATVATLQQTSLLSNEVSEEETKNDDLEIERSLDSSAQRVVRIATQNYGMVLATEVDTIELASDAESDEDAVETQKNATEIAEVAAWAAADVETITQAAVNSVETACEIEFD